MFLVLKFVFLHSPLSLGFDVFHSTHTHRFILIFDASYIHDLTHGSDGSGLTGGCFFVAGVSNAPSEAPFRDSREHLNGTSGNIWLLDCFGNLEAPRVPSLMAHPRFRDGRTSLCQLERLGCWAWVHGSRQFFSHRGPPSPIVAV